MVVQLIFLLLLIFSLSSFMYCKTSSYYGLVYKRSHRIIYNELITQCIIIITMNINRKFSYTEKKENYLHTGRHVVSVFSSYLCKTLAPTEKKVRIVKT